MKIGMPALIEYNTVEDNVLLCKKLGFDFIELNMNFPYNMIENLDPSYIKKLSSQNNIKFTMHMPDDADIGSFYPDVRNAYVKLFLDTIKWANEADITLINMHIVKGAHMTLPDKKVYINEKYSDEYNNNFISSLKIISQEAVKNNIFICIENSSNFELEYVQHILDKALYLDNIYLTWDVGHDYISNYTDKDVLFKYKNRIKHMHLHDANKDSDHLALFEGDLNIRELLKFANKNNLSTLVEVKNIIELTKSKEQLNKNLVK